MEILVVPPFYFDVVDQYNTRMRPDHPHGKPDKMRALLQWSRMISTLSDNLGVRIHFVSAQKELFDMTFACDAGLWVDDIFISANFWAKPRQPEVAHFLSWFKENGYRVRHLTPAALFEGGDCVMVKNKLIIGYGKERTNAEGVKEVTGIVKKHGVETVPIKRVTEEYYHLNSVLTFYPSIDMVAYYPPAFEKGVGDELKKMLPGMEIVGLAKQEVLRKHPDFGGEYIYSYALNALEQQGMALQPYCHPRHGEILAKRGVKVIVPEDGSSEFERSGGSYRCLTMIHNQTGS